MATEQPNSALRAPARPSRPYRKAHRGYGKRSAPGQRPPGAADFALLPERERYIAGYVDLLPDGAAMDIKSLAKDLPLYGQMAIGTALRALGVAGHLRHVRCRVESLGQSRWVTLTFWSRTARDNEWWAAHLDAESGRAAGTTAATAPPVTAEPVEAGEPTVAVPVPPQRSPEPAPADAPSPAHLALARLGRTEPRLALSASDCGALEDLAAAWFVRGVSADYLTQALVSGLPEQVGSPVGFVRRRLLDKIPARLPDAAPAPDTPARRLLVECTECGRPGPAESLPDGLCRPCRTPAPAEQEALAEQETPAGLPTERDVRSYVDVLRGKHRMPS
ncbi:MarR family transcriptional regulator [Streptomyces sp. NBC_00683]|uniref:MarR family transcriptional regulator n=1 Tax=Streptomyces sp. NBC_00683 TaxID=2903670 RepID=UPI002E36B31E|nr:MarR family transcriptional regulator [Streptomyces sp. NBC_00683]